MSNVEEIKERLGIVELLESYLKIEKSGSSFKARCPFHNEKTASFFISPERDTYYCFGCGKKGDIFTFVQEFEGVDFIGALKILAEKAGIELTFEKSEDNSLRNKIFDVLESSTKFYEDKLKKDSEPYKYLISRGLEDKTIREWRLGLAMDDWNSLEDFLKSKNYTQSLMESAGLIKKGDKGNYYDRFRGRIIFPIFDASSRTVGFTGRIIKPDDKQAKYLNSPETELFNKSKILYGFNFAKSAIRKNDFSILVEGQTDVLMSHQSGYRNTVATSGTAISDEQLDLLGRLSKRLVIALDADNAGFKASERVWKMALEKGMDVKVAVMPEGKDPADTIKENPNSWKNIIKNSEHIIDFLIHRLNNEKLDSRQVAQKVHSEIIPYISKLPSAVEQAHFIRNVNRVFDIDEKALWREIDGDNNEGVDDGAHREELIEVKKKDYTALNRIFGVYFWQESKEKSDIDLSKLENEIKEIIGESNFEKSKQKFKDEELIFETEKIYGESKILENDVRELIIALRKNILEQKRDFLKKKLHSSSGDDEREILKQIQKISKDMETLK